MSNQDLIPVNVLTGFLGSGKTTLLRRLLHSRQMANTAVLINEFGEVGLDHLLLERIDAATVLLESGCICCTIRSDLGDALRKLYAKIESAEIASLDRVVIETTGLADPAPIIFTLMAEPVVRHHFRLSNVIATVDAVNGPQHFADFPESVKQAAVADRLVLTKTDLAEPTKARKVRQALAQLNPSAPIFDAITDDLSPDDILAANAYGPKAKPTDIQNWLRAAGPPHEHASREGLGHHAAGITSCALVFDQALDWTAFGIWLAMLLNRHGERILRVKGILNVIGSSTPVCVNGVQHLVHPPVHLERWPDTDRRSRIIFIVRDIDPAAIRRSLTAFNGLADSCSTAGSDQEARPRTIAGGTQ